MSGALWAKSSLNRLPAPAGQLHFPQLQGAGERFTAHFVTSIVARVRRDHFDFGAALAELELAALYIAGENPSNGMQYHVQLSVL